MKQLGSIQLNLFSKIFQEYYAIYFYIQIFFILLDDKVYTLKTYENSGLSGF